MKNQETYDLAKIEQIQKDRWEAHKFFLEKSIVYRLFVEMEQKTFQDGNLSKKQKELITINLHTACRAEAGSLNTASIR
jgi:alkylhydroperoxidase/carboxymuconolactone decarboxylase family protein YurZ